MYRRIIVSVDASPAARADRGKANGQAGQTGASQRTFRPIESPSTAPDIDVVVSAPHRIVAEHERSPRRTGGEGMSVACQAVDHGLPRAPAAQAAPERKPDLAIVGTQGRRRATRMLLGSGAAQFPRAAPPSVMPVHRVQEEQ